jgi:sugar/nucleoside kinase (ribokinase family)
MLPEGAGAAAAGVALPRPTPATTAPTAPALSSPRREIWAVTTSPLPCRHEAAWQDRVVVVLCVGLATMDLVYQVAAPPRPDEKVTASNQQLAAGGPAAGAAVACAALGRPTTLLTALGRHLLAWYVADELTSRGVTVVDAAPDRSEPPAVSSVAVAAGGARSVISVNATGVAADPPAGLDALAAAASVVLVDGHHPGLAVPAAAAARRNGRLVVLDGGSWKPELPDLLPLVDLAACSAAFRVPGVAGWEESAVALRDRYGVPAVAVTAGPDPVRWWWTGPQGRQTGAVPVPTVAARDTLGAGDVFHGALAAALTLAGRLSGVDGLVAALEFAARVAAVRCETAGPRAWLADPRLAQLRAELATPTRPDAPSRPAAPTAPAETGRPALP